MNWDTGPLGLAPRSNRTFLLPLVDFSNACPNWSAVKSDTWAPIDFNTVAYSSFTPQFGQNTVWGSPFSKTTFLLTPSVVRASDAGEALVRQFAVGADQRGLWEASNLYIDHMGRGSFYCLLAPLRGQLFRDEEFAELYCTDNGRDSVPPSLLTTALLLQTYDRASDAEAKQRADFDIRWKVALGIEVEARPFAKSTL